MSLKVLYLANSGNGKSSSYCNIPTLGIKGLEPKSTAIINVIGKELNMRRWRDIYSKEKKNYYVTKDAKKICGWLDIIKADKTKKAIIIDDFQYALSLPFIDKIKPRAGVSWGEKYNEALEDVKVVFLKAGEMRDDQIVYILTHIDEYDGGEFGGVKYRMKAIGQSTHNNLTPEGMFENVLYGETVEVEEGKFVKKIRVKGRPNDTCKTAEGLFKSETIHIPNDLSIVDKKIREFYGI